MKLIVFSGLPGTGTSTLAEVIEKELSIPVFAKDWPEATLLRSGLKPVTEDKCADRKVTECICSDESLHCSKLKDRKRNIQGWHELEWAEVERIKN